YNKVVSLYSFSKSYAMSGLRLGYFASLNELFNDRAGKLLRCTVNGINSISQWGAIHAVKDTPAEWYAEMNAEYLKRRDLFLESLKGQDVLIPYVPKAAFYLWCRVKDGIDVEKLSEELAARGLGNAPGSCFGDTPSCRQSIRLAFSCDTKMIIEGSVELNKFLKDYK
ncbi:MAG: aminotransferase class I/II-fold pyridoxal phosphate-dependent enzyme, partial [Bdellovibrionales bacterium]|nr:aminotransferase class I/II-fold pyridoxal phosphate-dependent enzyme [Bdellovibrionales bacterium]